MTQMHVPDNSFGVIEAAVYNRAGVSDPDQVTTAGLNAQEIEAAAAKLPVRD